MMPAMKAVAAATIPMEAPTAAASITGAAPAGPSKNLGAPEIRLPLMSVVVPMMSGFSAMMYAIAKNVTRPPRTSCPTDEPCLEIRK